MLLGAETLGGDLENVPRRQIYPGQTEDFHAIKFCEICFCGWCDICTFVKITITVSLITMTRILFLTFVNFFQG